MSATNFTENLALNWLLTNGAATRPTAWFVALHSADPTEAGNVAELTGNGYARVAATFAAASGGATSNTGAVQFGPSTGAWTTATHFSIWDASTAGNSLFKGALAIARTIGGASETITFAIGELDVTAE